MGSAEAPALVFIAKCLEEMWRGWTFIDRLNGITDVTKTYVISAATVFLFFFSVHRFAVIQH